MSKLLFSGLFIFCFTLSSLATEPVSVPAAAPVINSQCQKSASGGAITGENANQAYTIASVSKIFTAHWAIVSLGPRYRYQNKIHISPLGKNIYNVHIEGDLFPYFDKTMFQFLISELNKLKVFQINNLTFDENFKYATSIRTNDKLAHQYFDLSPIEIVRDLRADSLNINAALTALAAKALNLENLKILPKLNLKINHVAYLPQKNFQRSSKTLSYLFQSSELHRNLKEINRNSHNFAADRLFEKLSKKENFLQFFTNHFNLPAVEIDLRNGSGYPIAEEATKFYNQASCAAVVEMMFDLRKNLLKSGLTFKDIVAVVGKDSIEDGESMLTKTYGKNINAGSLIAKTGTVSGVVTLAGMILTSTENLFFQTNYSHDGSLEAKSQVYLDIKNWINSIIQKNGNNDDLADYAPKAYMPFDSQSALKELKTSTLP